MSDEPQVTLLEGGDTVYAFLDPDMAAMQYTVMIGANLDVECFRVSLARWHGVRTKLAADDGKIEIIDMTNGTGEGS